MALLTSRAQRRGPRRRRALGRIVAAVVAGFAACASAQAIPLEYAVKAAYLYKFAPFVEWPPRAFAGATDPFNLCIVGADPFGPALDSATRGQQVAGHPVVVRRLPRAERNSGCQLMFASGSKTQSVDEMLRAVAGQPVLTVTDRRAGAAGGMIEFVLVDGHVRFDIDPVAAQASGVTISSKLLSLAVSLRRSAR